MNLDRFLKVKPNLYLVIAFVFVIWMLFFDSNSFSHHRELNKEIEKLENWNAYHREKLAEELSMIKKIKNKEALERYARERYLMRKDNEEVFIIEFDTIKAK